MDKIASRTPGGYGTVFNATTPKLRPGRLPIGRRMPSCPTSTTATSIPSSDVPLISPTTRISALQLALQLVQQLQRFDGTKLVHIQLADALGEAVVNGLEHLNLHRAVA